MMIVVQMFKLARLPCFCKTDVVGSAFLGFIFPPILNGKQNIKKMPELKINDQTPHCSKHLLCEVVGF